MRLAYPAKFVEEKRDGGFSVSFPDFPEGHTQGDTLEEAFRMALDCLRGVIEWRLEEKTEIPAPSQRRGFRSIPVALDLAPKIALYQAMRARKVSNVALADQLGVSETVVRRMLNPNHQSKNEQYTRALLALGQTPEVSIIGI